MDTAVPGGAGPGRGRLTRLGLHLPSFTGSGPPGTALFDRVAAAAVAAEQAGFDSLWVMDHFVQIPQFGPPTDPMLEPYTLLGALAARTSGIRLGTLVTGVTYRNPALLAKIVTTLDVVSGGRAALGVGAAWHAGEHAGYGYPFPPLRERFERLEDTLRICRALFTQDGPVTVEGRHHHVREALNRPGPVQPGGPPILVGGNGERRTLALVARYADACNLFGDLATVRRKLAVLAGHCAAVGRDPATVTTTRLAGLVVEPTSAAALARAEGIRAARGISVEAFAGSFISGDPDTVAEAVLGLLEAGLDGLIVHLPDPYDPEALALAGQTLRRALAAGAAAGDQPWGPLAAARRTELSISASASVRPTQEAPSTDLPGSRSL